MTERRKIMIEYEPYAPPEEPAPEQCDICREMKPAWQFAGRTPRFCIACSSEAASWAWNVSDWTITQKLAALQTIVHRLRKEAYGRPARHI